MRKQERAVIVEVKRSGRKPLVTAVQANRPTVLLEPAPPPMMSGEARRAADLLFAPRTQVAGDEMVMPDTASASADMSGGRRVLPSLVEPLAVLDEPVEPEPEAEAASRRGAGGRRRRTETVRQTGFETEVVARALETIERLGRSRGSAAASAEAARDLFEERRAKVDAAAQPKRRGRPPKARPVAIEVEEPRIWASSKILIEDEAPAPVAAMVRPAAAPAAPLRSRHLRESEFKPGERWKRRLRGHAR